MASTSQSSSSERPAQGQSVQVAGHRLTREILRSPGHIRFNDDPQHFVYFYCPSRTASPQTDSKPIPNDVRSIYHDETNTLLTEVHFEDGQLATTTRSTICQQNHNASVGSTYLEQFCAVTILPVPAMQRIRVAAVVLAQSLAQYLKPQAGKTSLSTAGAHIPFGIRLVNTTASQSGSAAVQALNSKLVGWKIQRFSTSTSTGYTFHPPMGTVQDGAHTYKLIVEHQSEAFLQTFGVVPADRQLAFFEDMVILGLHIFNRMIDFVQKALVVSEASLLVRSIALSKYKQLTTVNDNDWQKNEQSHTSILRYPDGSSFITSPVGSAIIPRGLSEKDFQETVNAIHKIAVDDQQSPLLWHNGRKMVIYDDKTEEESRAGRVSSEEATAAYNDANAIPSVGDDEGVVDDLATNVAAAAIADDVPVERSADSTSPTSSTSVSTIRPSQPPLAVCRLPSCGQPCQTTTTSTHTCPNCGPFSAVRYCSKDHLYEDLRRHYVAECRACTTNITPSASSLGLTTLPIRPYLHPGPGIIPTIERHRQAVYYSTEEHISYHVFDDLSAASVLLRPQIIAARGTGTLLHSVTFHDPSLSYFGLWVARYLVYGATTLEAQEMCERMMVLVRRKCMDDGMWDEEFVTRLCMQVGCEVDWSLPMQLREMRGVNEY